MRLRLIARIAIVAFAAGLCQAEDKKTVYNHVDGEETPLGKAVIAALSPKVSIIDIPSSDDYAEPKVTGGSLPQAASTADGQPLGGKVVVGYVVTEGGRVGDAVILESSDKRLDPIVQKAMEAWRFEPAKWKGRAIATLAAQDFVFQTAPAEFVTQVLEPTGGKIQRPKDWFYKESQNQSGYLWTISREDSTKGPYLTGMRIQLLSGVKKATGKTAEQFIRDFIEKKKKEADKVVNLCDPKEQYLFTRMCLETEEGPFHILYSLFWGTDDLDMAVIVIAGAPAELWDTYAPAFDKMGNFELIDMKRFEDKSEKND